MRTLILSAAVLVALFGSISCADVSTDYCSNLQFTSAANNWDKQLAKTRCQFNVYYFTSNDYPAMFAIFAGLVIILVLAVAFIVAGMVSMNPGKDSIIYRMTTTRMKKD
ncbi:hypothetical protein L596_026341 [Steinernema carpocapsae]|uniref:Renin receptor-like C-terminal transmembrane spanning segment domain-containing protein n=1 Tax=Steinernema carpocapsae TaxID=34508 RepID=A0A4U5M222_STECR|nr:hypothetical protein L596_026341 [Steinernema carpocapsae]